MMGYVSVACGVAIAAVFGLSAGGKLRRLAAFERSLAGLRLFSARWSARVARLVVTLEVIIVLAFVTGRTEIAFLLAGALLTAFTAIIAWTMRNGVDAVCQCFGFGTSRFSLAHLVRNALLTSAAIAGLLGGFHDEALNQVGVAVAAVSGLVAAIVISAMDDILARRRRRAVTR
jgi:hypothetical protein